jgi:hypothetical protein
MFVYDFIQLALPFEVVSASLLDGAGRWLSSLATQACAEGEGQLVDIGIASERARILNKLVRVELGEPYERDRLLTVPMSWRATGLPTLFPSLDADLEIARLSERRTHLSLMGRYQPPLGRIGRLLDQNLLHYVAEGSVRMFLRRVAAALEAEEIEPQPSAGSTASG